MPLVPGPFIIMIILMNTKGSKLPLENDQYMQLLNIAHDYNWRPAGVTEIFSDSPSLAHYMPSLRSNERTIHYKDAWEISEALNAAKKKIAPRQRAQVMASDNAAEQAKQDQREKDMDMLVWFFMVQVGGYVIVHLVDSLEDG